MQHTLGSSHDKVPYSCSPLAARPCKLMISVFLALPVTFSFTSLSSSYPFATTFPSCHHKIYCSPLSSLKDVAFRSGELDSHLQVDMRIPKIYVPGKKKHKAHNGEKRRQRQAATQCSYRSTCSKKEKLERLPQYNPHKHARTHKRAHTYKRARFKLTITSLHNKHSQLSFLNHVHPCYKIS